MNNKAQICKINFENASKQELIDYIKSQETIINDFEGNSNFNYYKLWQNEKDHSTAIINDLPIIIVDTNLLGTITFLNKYGKEKLEISDEDLKKGVNFFDFIHGEDFAKAMNYMEKKMLENFKGGHEYTIYKKDKTYFYAIIDSIPIVVDGVKIGLRGFVLDINEKKKAEQSILEREKEIELQRVYFKQLFDKSPEGILVLDKNEVVIDVNQEFTNIFQYTKEELFGKKINDFIIPEELIEETSQILDFAIHNKFIQFETRRVRKDKTVVDISILATPIVFNNNQIGFYVIYRDISDKKRVTNALNESEEKFKRMAESISDGVTIIENNKIIYVNNKILEIFEIDSSQFDITTFNIFKYCDVTEAERLKKYISNCKESGKPPMELEFWIVTGKGKRKYIHNRYSNKSNGNKTDRYIITTDATQRKLAEESLKESENTYRTIFENTGTSSILFDNSGIIQLCNTEFLYLSGYCNKEIENIKSIFDFIIDENEELKQKFEKLFKYNNGKHIPLRFELNFKNKNQEIKRVLVNIAHIPNKTLSIASIQDITELKKAEESIQKNVKLFKSYFDLPLVGIAITNNDNRWITVNDKLCEMLGFTREELLTISWKDITPKEDLNNEILKFNEFKNDLNIRTYEKKYFRKDGSILNVLLSTAIVKKSDNVVDYYVSVIQDITEQKQSEIAIKLLNSELVEKNKELEQIIHVTSHDLRSPLVNIQGFGKEIEKSFKEFSEEIEKIDDAKKIKELFKEHCISSLPVYLEYILNGTRKMDVLLSGLLKLSRMGRQAMNPILINVEKLVKEVIQNFEFKTNQINAKISIQILPDCVCDEQMIIHIFSNLIDNALKYSSKERKPVIIISGEHDKINKQTIYSVKDNGIGISNQYLSKIFELFQRLEPEIEGEGLGLTIISKFLDKINGKIWVESELNKGSIFYFTIPDYSN